MQPKSLSQTPLTLYAEQLVILASHIIFDIAIIWHVAHRGAPSGREAVVWGSPEGNSAAVREAERRRQALGTARTTVDQGISR